MLRLLAIAAVSYLCLLSTADAQQWVADGLKNVKSPFFTQSGTYMAADVNGMLVAWEVATGRELWRTSVGKISDEEPLHKLAVDDKWFITVTSDAVVATSIADGSQRVLVNSRNVVYTGQIDDAVVVRHNKNISMFSASTLDEIFQRNDFRYVWQDTSSHIYVVLREKELTVLHTKTKKVSTFAVEAKEVHERARDKVFFTHDHISLVTEDGFLTYNVTTGKQTSKIAHELGDIENYFFAAVDNQPALLISHEDRHELHNTVTGAVVTISTKDLPGIADRVIPLSNQKVCFVTYDEDNALRVAYIDTKSSKLLWSNVVGLGRMSYHSAHNTHSFGSPRLGSFTPDTRNFLDQQRVHPFRFNSSTKTMEIDIERVVTGISSGIFERNTERIIRIMMLEARKPIPNVIQGIKPRRAFGDVCLLSENSNSVSFLVYGGVYRTLEDFDNYPNGEGVFTFDLNQGTSTYTPVPLYGNEDTPRTFNTDYMSDVREMGNGMVCVFADSAIAYVSPTFTTRVHFHSRKIAQFKGTLDSMWVIDVDPETDHFLYYTLTVNRRTGETSTRLSAVTDEPCYTPGDWSSDNISFSYIKQTLSVYDKVQPNIVNFAGLSPRFVVSRDSIRSHGYGYLHDDDNLDTPYGIRMNDSLIIITGRDAVGFQSTQHSHCTAVYKIPEQVGEKTGGLFDIHSNYVLASSKYLTPLQVTAPCSIEAGQRTEVDDEYETIRTPNGIFFIDRDKQRITYFSKNGK